MGEQDFLRRKKSLLIVILMLITPIIGITVITVYQVSKTTKEYAFIGHLKVYFYDNVADGRIDKIIEFENISLINKEDISLPKGGGQYETNRLVKIEVENWERRGSH
ncbi:MAG: hypothetical protein ACMUIE_08225 [Thermoplasmatota archaeon]